MNKKIKIGAAILALAVICAIVWAIARPPAIECVTLKYTALKNTFNEIGEVIPVSEADLFTKNGGKLLNVNAVEGSFVNKGDLLFEFDGNEERVVSLKTQKSSLESDQISLRIQIEQAYIEENRSRDLLESTTRLYEQGAVSSQELDDAQSAYELAVKSRESASARLSYADSQIPVVNGQIENNQSEILVFAPQDGIVRDMSVKEGHVIAPGSKLCSVYEEDLYRVDCYILVENSEGVNMGDKVEVAVRLRDVDKIYQGKVSGLGQGAVDIVSKVGLSEKRIKVEIEPDGGWDGLYPYWPVETRFITAESKDCLVVPKSALFEADDGSFNVWAVRDGKLIAATVEKGVETPSQIEIRGELSADEIIVKNSKIAGIKEGKRVRAIGNNN